MKLLFLPGRMDAAVALVVAIHVMTAVTVRVVIITTTVAAAVAVVIAVVDD